MTMVEIGNMDVVMNKRLVGMPVTVCSFWHRVVPMGVVPVVMAMGVLMFERFVPMNMTMVFGRMQVHAQKHECRSRGKPEAKISLAQHKGD